MTQYGLSVFYKSYTCTSKNHSTKRSPEIDVNKNAGVQRVRQYGRTHTEKLIRDFLTYYS